MVFEIFLFLLASFEAAQPHNHVLVACILSIAIIIVIIFKLNATILINIDNKAQKTTPTTTTTEEAYAKELQTFRQTSAATEQTLGKFMVFHDSFLDWVFLIALKGLTTCLTTLYN